MTSLERAVEAVAEGLIGHVDPYTHAMSEYGIASMIVPIVLQAIREPSDEWVAKAMQSETVIAWGDYREFWLAMIDAALAEQK